ncbi:MAG: collagen-like protein [Gammaproteobacteria bacterium]|nr:collagen-like protein [Gammaproteobacteria bacterium]
MELTQQQVNDLIARLLATNTMGEVTAADVRQVLTEMVGYTQQTDAKVEAIRLLAQTALDKANANEIKDGEQDGRLTATEGVANTASTELGKLANRVTAIEEGDAVAGTLTPEQIEQNTEERHTNSANIGTLQETATAQGNAIGALQTKQGTQDTAITNAGDAARGAREAANAVNTRVDGVVTRVGQNEADISNHKTQKFDPLAVRVGEAETEIDGLDGKTDATNTEVGKVRTLAQEALDQHDISRIDGQDFIEEAGRIDAVNPSVRYSGVNGDDPTFAEITLPLSQQLTDLEAGRLVRVSNMYLIPLFGDQGGAESLFFYRIEQGSETLSGRGNPTAGEPSRQVIERDWIQVNVEDSSAELVFTAKTGSDPVIRVAMIWTGESGSFSPRVTAGDLHFIGRLRDPVAGVVRDVVGGALDGLEANDATQTADIAGLRADVDTNTQTGVDNGALAHALRDRLDAPQLGVIENATIGNASSVTIDPTALNNELGGDSPFARQLVNRVVAEETQFLTRVTSADQVLDYGAGRVLDVFEGRVRGFILRPAQDATSREETRYITTDGGLGTRAEPAVLEFGNGGATPRAEDNEVFLTQGIPAVGAEITNISMAFAVRTNGNWSSIANTLQFAIRSGESRNFNVPNVVGVVFTATALADGRIRARATHPNGGDPNQLATNGGAIRFDAAFVETIRTPAVTRGQETVDLGAFTGNNLVGFDAIQTGDNGEATAHYVTPAGRFDTGYFILDVHRVAFATDNPAFTFLASDADTPLTADVMARLDRTDEYLGLFTRNNHHADELRVATGLRVPTSDGAKTYNIADEIQGILQGVIDGGFRGSDGIDGNDGADGQSLTARGTWSDAVQYSNRDLVFYLPTRSAYVSMVDSNGAVPTDTNYWMLVSEQGVQGEQGERGEKGDTGATGMAGAVGAAGADGADGAKGEQGERGEKGDQGIQGIQGVMGIQGNDGARGVQGETGATGGRGDKGETGDDGLP